MIEIESVGWYIFLIVAAAVILFFNWLFLKETKKIQEKLKGMKSFTDIIDATNQALDEFNVAFEEAGQVIEKRREELMKLVQRAEQSIKRLEELQSTVKHEPVQDADGAQVPEPGETVDMFDEGASADDRVETIKRWLAQGKSAGEISRLTGASIREVELVEKFTAGR